MKFVFSILAILVCVAAAYFTISQTEKFDEEQKARYLAIDTNKNVTAEADKADVEIEEEKRLLEISKQNLATATASVEQLTQTSRQLKSEMAKLDDELEKQKVDFDEIDKAIKSVQEILADLGGDVTIENLPDKVASIEEDIKVKREKVDELNTLIEGAEKSLETKKAAVALLVGRKDARNLRIERNAMEARVTAVNQDWGFLVIGAGSNSGFTPQSALLVQRNGILIGRVKPSAIEATQTIAEIDAKSLSPGVRIQPGDRVILAKPSSN